MALLSLLIVGSIVLSTALIMINKKVMETYDFGFPTTMTSYHFAMTYIGCYVMGKMHMFDPDVQIPKSKCWYLGFLSVLSIVSMNFNLRVNSIGFYQLSKLCTIPCTVAYKYFFLKKSTPANSLFSLLILLVGVSLFTVNDVQFSIAGMFVALGAVISTTINQSQSSVVQNEYNINGAQLNYVSGIQQFVICAIAAFLIETTGRERIQDHHFQTIEIVLILLTGVIATGCNVVGASLIGKAGPVTYQVVGHVKTMLIFTFGLIMFPVKDEPRYRQMKKIGGLLVSMVGVILYTIFEMKNKNKVAEEEEHLLSNPKPEPVLDDIFMEEENNAEFKEDL